jgi:hypothetical protein
VTWCFEETGDAEKINGKNVDDASVRQCRRLAVFVRTDRAL